MKNAELIGIIYDISDGLTSHNLFIYIYLERRNCLFFQATLSQ